MNKLTFKKQTHTLSDHPTYDIIHPKGWPIGTLNWSYAKGYQLNSVFGEPVCCYSTGQLTQILDKLNELNSK